MYFDEKLSDEQKVLALAKVVLPIYNNTNLSKDKGNDLADRKVVLAWFDTVDLSYLDDKNLILFLELQAFAEIAYPNYERILVRKNFNSDSPYVKYREDILKRYYSDETKRFKYHLELLKKFLAIINNLKKDKNLSIQTQNALIVLRMSLLFISFEQHFLNDKHFNKLVKLIETNDFESINTILVIEIEHLIYQFANLCKIDIYKEEDASKQGFVIKQILRPEIILEKILNHSDLKHYQGLFYVILQTMYKKDLYLFLKPRYTQRMNGKLLFDDAYVTNLLMLIAITLKDLINFKK